jgi:hypothetical protein
MTPARSEQYEYRERMAPELRKAWAVISESVSCRWKTNIYGLPSSKLYPLGYAPTCECPWHSLILGYAIRHVAGPKSHFPVTHNLLRQKLDAWSQMCEVAVVFMRPTFAHASALGIHMLASRSDWLEITEVGRPGVPNLEKIVYLNAGPAAFRSFADQDI